jgi:hypothetical protein
MDSPEEFALKKGIKNYKPEEITEIILWSWIKTQSTNVLEIYFNRKNNINAPIFQTKGINKKPDLLIKINRGYGIEYVAVEVKPTTSSKTVHDSSKILNYYKNYVLNKTEYYINSEKIFLNHFVVATDNSPKGKLFADDEVLVCNGVNSDSHRKLISEWSLFPEFEYQRTSDYLRRLWAEWRILKKEINQEKDLPSIGICISNPNKDSFVYLAIMNYNSYLTKPKWGQRFWRI